MTIDNITILLYIIYNIKYKGNNRYGTKPNGIIKNEGNGRGL